MPKPNTDGDNEIMFDLVTGTEQDDAGNATGEQAANAGADDLEIEVVDDTPPKDKGRKPLAEPVAEPTDEELAGYSEGVKKRIKSLTHARHDERRRADALQRERDEALRVAQTLMERTKAVETQFNTGAQQYAAMSKQAAQAAVAAATEQLRKAKEAYDTEAELAAQDALLEAKIALREANNFRPPAFQPVEEVVQIPQAEPDDQIHPKTREWKARNASWFGQEGYEDATSFALGLHQKLVNSGVDPRTDEYFEKVDENLRKRFPELNEDADADDEPPAKPKLKKPAVVAGATRTVAGVRKVQLTQTQLGIAKTLGLTPQQYAAELVKLEKAK